VIRLIELTIVRKSFSEPVPEHTQFPHSTKRWWKGLLGHWRLPLIVAFLVRVVAAFYWEWYFGGKFVFGDSESYWVLARALAEGEEYRYGNARIFRMPGYPAVLAPLFWLAADEPPYVWARIEGAVLGTLAVWGIFLLGRFLADERVGIVAAWWAALYPGAIGLSIWILSEALFCPVMILGLLTTARSFQADEKRQGVFRAVIAGAIHGLAILTRPSWLFFPFFAGLVAIAAGPARLRQTGRAVAMMAATVCTLVPWWIRNWCLTGRWIPTTLQVGASLYDGLHPLATGGSDLSYVSAKMAEWAKELATRGAELRGEPPGGSEVKERSESNQDTLSTSAPIPFEGAPGRYPEERRGICRKWGIWEISDRARKQIDQEVLFDTRLREEALRWAWANPQRVVSLAVVKLKRLWNIWPNEPAFQNLPVRLTVALTFLPTFGFAILGLVMGGWRSWGWVCTLPALYFTGIHCVFVSSLRYREPAILALLPMAALGLVHVLDRLSASRQGPAWSKETKK
jgi:hypothetical protein